ncbi:MAG: dihydroorotate dehydrogenase-like protein [Vicinamibacterales bacterium]|nr:dihydroorotate dehydrogenase-like protein [Vicinamibacterales bacterium]
MADLGTTYLGLDLAHPVVASASPLAATIDGLRRLEDAGAAAIVLPSLFEEQIRLENAALEALTALGADSVGEVQSYFPVSSDFVVGPDAYLDFVREAKTAVGVPVIASLNAVTPTGWTGYAEALADAGADAIELNVFYIPADLAVTGRDVEQRYEDIVREVCGAVSVPVAIKLSPFFSATGEMAARLVAAGAEGLVLFNRFYQPDMDLERLEVAPTLELSTPAEIRLPLLWIAVLHGRISASLAATTGVQTPTEVVKYVLAGADVVMTTSALLQHGPAHLRTLVDGLASWLDRRGYASVAQVKGAMSQQHVADPSAFERANYMKVLQSWKTGG